MCKVSRDVEIGASICNYVLTCTAGVFFRKVSSLIVGL